MFTGIAGAGKTTISIELNKRNWYAIFSFATRLKEIAKQIKMGELDKTQPKDRWLLQILGTEVGRAYDPDMWVKQLAKDINDGYTFSGMPDDIGIAIDDCRFLNEAKWGRENGYKIIRIIGRGYTLDPTCANHASEVEQRSIVADFELDNSGTLDETMDKLYSYLNTL
jgi:hypothetical protein